MDGWMQITRMFANFCFSLAATNIAEIRFFTVCLPRDGKKSVTEDSDGKTTVRGYYMGWNNAKQEAAFDGGDRYLLRLISAC